MKKILNGVILFVIMVVSVFALTGCGNKNVDKKRDNKENTDVNESVSNTSSSNNEGNTSANNVNKTDVAKTQVQLDKTPIDFKDKANYYFMANGVKYTFENKLEDITSSGYKASDKINDQDVPSKKYLLGGEYFRNPEGKTVFSVTPINYTAETVKENKASIGGFTLDKYYFENSNGNISICNGITIGTAMADVETIFGEPSEKDMRDDYPSLGIKYTYKVGAYKYFEFEFDKTTKNVTKVTWRYFDM